MESNETEEVFQYGAFFLKGKDMYADIRLEFNVNNPKYNFYFKKLKELVSDAEKDRVLLSSSGI